jgi:hypothetical protein
MALDLVHELPERHAPDVLFVRRHPDRGPLPIQIRGPMETRPTVVVADLDVGLAVAQEPLEHVDAAAVRAPVKRGPALVVSVVDVEAVLDEPFYDR